MARDVRGINAACPQTSYIIMQNHTISALRLYLSVLAFFFGIMALFRILFWLAISSDLPAPLGPESLKAFYIGLRFDARIAALITLPFGLAACIPPLMRRLGSFANMATAAYAPFVFLLVLIYSIDLGFYFYLGNRVTRLLFELLQDFGDAVQMVSQSYPVGLITVGILATAALTLYCLNKIIKRPVEYAKSRRRRAAGFAFGFLVFALAVYGQINASLFPLRWSHAFFTTNDAVIALGLNPVQSLYDTYGADSSGFSLEEAQKAYPTMTAFLKIDAPDPATLNYRRSVSAKQPAPRPPLNIVIIVMESLSYPKTSFAPGRNNPTPYLKALSKQSLLFHRYFANARTTARGVFSLMTGLPDVNVGSTGSRNPLVVDQRVVANEFEGYDKYYLIGGNTSWANIRAVLAQNVQDLKILEESNWKAKRVDVWGVSDYDLMQEAHKLFSALDKDKPFLAVVQTAGFHKPYTIPKTPGFKHLDISEADMANYGFESVKEFNSLRYSDFALGEFLRKAMQSEYYDNTVFFILGDHGLNDPSKNMPASYSASNLAPWHVPLIIHASPHLGLFEPGESYLPCSHVDVFPTAAGIAGIAYNNWTMGRDIFDSRFDADRVVYIGGKKTEGIRLVYGDYCYLDNLLGARQLYRITDSPAVDLSERESALFNGLAGLANNMDATIRYMLFNNKKNSRQSGRTDKAADQQE